MTFDHPPHNGRLTPTIAYTTPTGPGRIHVNVGLLRHMERDLDAAIAEARAAGGSGIRLEIMEGSTVVIRQRVAELG